MSRPDFEEIYESLFDPILNYAFRRIGDYDVAKDITSEVFMKVYLNLWKFRWRNIPIRAWVYRIATNEINLYFRKNKYRSRIMEDYRVHALLSMDENVQEAEKNQAREELEKHEQFRRVHHTIKEMDLKYQEVLSLRLFEELSIREISEILGKKEGTVKSLLSRGMKKIRSHL